MIIEGKPAGSVGFWSKHLQREDTNERVRLVEVRGTLAQDLEGALYEMQAVASGSRSRGNFMYQANINPYAGEQLTPEQWQKAVDTLEKNLGLEDHQRVVVEHVKDGRQHYHVIWNRVDVDTMRVCDVGGNYYTHERTARQLEQEFGLERAPRVYGEREGERVSKRTELWEYNRGQESGQSPKAIKAELTALWNAADSGRAFVGALEQQGYILAKGDRRDFCVIDRAGDEHSLARRLEGVTARQLRERLGYLDRDSLPSVEQAKALQEQRQAELGRSAPNRDTGPDDQREESGRDARATPRQDPRAGDRAPPTARATREPADTGIKVFDRASGAINKLADFVLSLGEAIFAPSPPRSVFDRLNDSPAERVESLKAQRRAGAALENIRDDLERGATVSAADLRSLTAGHLQQIMQKGDAGLLALVQRLEEERAQDRDPGRGRER